MKNRYLYSTTEITAIKDSDNSLWQAFLGSDDSCSLKKSDIFSPDNHYWELTINASKITSLHYDDNYIYGSLNSATYLGVKVNKSSITDITYYTIPSGINEEGIDLICNDTYLFILTPGSSSGENAKIIKYNKSTRVFIETIDLNYSGIVVTNAKKIDIDNADNLWVVSETNPIILTKIFYNGLVWDLENYILS